MSVLSALGGFAASATMGSQGAAMAEIQRRHVVDALAAAVVGHTTEDARALRAVLPDRPLGYRVAAVRLTEVDDIHCASCVTPSSVVVPAALTAIERDPAADPARLADALWVGTELMTRLGAAIDGARLLYRGIWPTCFCAPVGVAGTIGRLIGLDEGRMADALAIALNLAAGAVGRRDAPRAPRWLLIAVAAEAGATAARAAASGFGGDAGLLDGPDWLLATHGIEADTDRLTDGLGETCVYAALSLKPYCSAKQAVAAVEAVRGLIADGLDPSAIERIEVRVPPPYAGMIARTATPDDRSSTLVSAAYQIALAVLRPDAAYDVARSVLPFDEEIIGLMERVSVGADDAPALMAHFPARFPAAVTVTAAGRSCERRVIEALGDPGNRLDDAGLAEKIARVLAAAGLEDDEIRSLSAAGWALSEPAEARALAARIAARIAAVTP